MQPAANVTSGDAVDWQAIDWKRVYRTVEAISGKDITVLESACSDEP